MEFTAAGYTPTDDDGVALEDSNGVIVTAGIALTPKMWSINPKVGTVGGTLITVTVPGVGTATEGLTLVNPSGNSICQELTITAYGTVQCLTKDEDFGAEALAISAKLDGVTYECVNPTATECAYTQSSTAESFPVITATRLDAMANTITYTGTNLYKLGYTASAKFIGIDADGVVVNEAMTEAVATWNRGVPVTSETDSTVLPDLLFLLNDSTTVFYAINNGSGDAIKVLNPFSLTASTGPTAGCSFNGGCEYTMQGTRGI